MHHMTARKIASGLLLVAVLGILAGYLGTWITYRNELVHGASYVSHEYTLLAFSALPGSIITECFSSGDWQLLEAREHRHLLASANGFFWVSVAGTFYLLRFIFLPRPTPPSIVVDALAVGTAHLQARDGQEPDSLT
jgi:hypothetical protein